MRVLIQWATATATDWVEYDITSISQVRALPKKPEPTDSDVLDDSPGWLAAINIQGIVFTGFDHIGFGITSVNGETALQVTCWNDDPADFPAGTRWGQVWTLLDPAPDPAFGGQVNTRQSVEFFGEPGADVHMLGVPVRPWAELSLPHKNNTIHGVWTSDGQWQALTQARSSRGWREWVAP